MDDTDGTRAVVDGDRGPHPLPVVLVHGAWHGAWCWSAMQAELDRLGIASYAVDLPGHGASTSPSVGMLDDAAQVAAAVDVVARRHGRQVVLVGHSYGGAVITEAAARTDQVGALVYVAAFTLDAGESVMSLLTSLPRAEVTLSAAIRPAADGTSTVDPALAPAAFAARCEPDVVAAAIPRLCPQRMTTFTDPVSQGTWRRIRATYVVCTEDEAVHPSHQEAMAARCAAVHRLTTDHSPFLSAPGETAAIVAGVARSTGLGPNDGGGSA